MPALPVHFSVLQRLIQRPDGLPAQVRQALEDDLEYARFGTALADLPYFDGSLLQVRPRFAPEVPPFARTFHSTAPVALGLRLAEIVAHGSLVGQSAGLAVVSGYFAHLVVDRALHPLLERLLPEAQAEGEPARSAHRRVEWLQALFFLDETHGKSLLGTPELEALHKVRKRRGPLGGVGGGLFELVRISSRETFGVAPLRAELDHWLRGLYLHAKFLGSPLSKSLAPTPADLELFREIYRGPGIRYFDELAAAEASCRQVLERVFAYMERGDFSPIARGELLVELPEGAIDAD